MHKVFYKQQQLTEQQHKYNQLDACFFKTIPYFHKNETCRVLHTAHYICYFADLKIRFFFFFLQKADELTRYVFECQVVGQTTK